MVCLRKWIPILFFLVTLPTQATHVLHCTEFLDGLGLWPPQVVALELPSDFNSAIRQVRDSITALLSRAAQIRRDTPRLWNGPAFFTDTGPWCDHTTGHLQTVL